MVRKNNFREEDVLKENILFGSLLLLVGSLLLIANITFDNFWLKIIAIVFLAIGGVIIFMILFISFTNEFKSDILTFVWSELLYLLLGIPLASICVLIIPATIYILMFGGDPRDTWVFSVFFTLSLMASSLIYTAVKIWLENRSSGLKVPQKVEKGPIEQLLYRTPSVED